MSEDAPLWVVLVRLMHGRVHVWGPFRDQATAEGYRGDIIARYRDARRPEPIDSIHIEPVRQI